MSRFCLFVLFFQLPVSFFSHLQRACSLGDSPFSSQFPRINTAFVPYVAETEINLGDAIGMGREVGIGTEHAEEFLLRLLGDEAIMDNKD